MDTWYFSPYPSELCYNHQLFICEYCFAYFNNSPFYKYHMKNECSYRQPPGDEIYRDGNLSLYEVDGKYNKRYCQYLCLLSKLFLDHKTLYFDVEHFLFYILCEVDDYGAHIVGHFSKERASMNNLACIIVFPPYQRKGYGQFLIQVSYALSSREGFIGTPEKPLSDMGKVSYRSYWWWILLKALDHASLEHVPLHELSLTTGIHEEDIMTTLQPMNLLKPWNGITFVRCGKKYIEHLKTLNLTRPPKLLLQVELLRWLPKIRRDGF
uniref:Histone acetyltransferase n=1 Tax=Strongyloides stercoralis TaxID=6248 RepID=A0AAF5D3J8_STRER